MPKINPDRVLGLELYDRNEKREDRASGWKAVSYEYEGDDVYIQFEHPKFQPWDISIHKLEAVMDLIRGKEYLREK